MALDMDQGPQDPPDQVYLECSGPLDRGVPPETTATLGNTSEIGPNPISGGYTSLGEAHRTSNDPEYISAGPVYTTDDPAALGEADRPTIGTAESHDGLDDGPGVPQAWATIEEVRQASSQVHDQLHPLLVECWARLEALCGHLHTCAEEVAELQDTVPAMLNEHENRLAHLRAEFSAHQPQLEVLQVSLGHLRTSLIFACPLLSTDLWAWSNHCNILSRRCKAFKTTWPKLKPTLAISKLGWLNWNKTS